MIYVKRIFLSIGTLFTVLLCVILSSHSYASAMKVDRYSYKKLHDALPSKFQSDDFVYTESNGYAYVKFAMNGTSPYRTTVKKRAGNDKYLYCADYSKHILFGENYSEKKKFFSNKLETKIAIALYYGTREWGKKADSTYTTGNSVMDYYMTQLVIHGLIYKYGGEKSSYGVNFDKVTFNSKAGNLEKKTKALYKYCCDAKIEFSDGTFQPVKFSFATSDSELLLEGNVLESGEVSCKTNAANASVKSFSRSIASEKISKDLVKLVQTEDNYNSPFKLNITAKDLDNLTPGIYQLSVKEDVTFKPYISQYWSCSASGLVDQGQEVVDITTKEKKASDTTNFKIAIGSIALKKTDSLTGENISGAIFEVWQYDESQNGFVYDKQMNYNAATQVYESGNLYFRKKNPDRKFLVVEKQSQANYINDWSGVVLQLTDDNLSQHITVTNNPELGKIRLKKAGENFICQDMKFKKTKAIPLNGIKFSLYAAEDISTKNKFFYSKDQLITDVVTNANGEAEVSNLPNGKYYFIEKENNPYHKLNSEKIYAEIIRDDNRKYSTPSYTIDNYLKDCKISVHKYYYDRKDTDQEVKLPLAGAKFGLYAADDIINLSGECVVKKDGLIQEGYTDENGDLEFKDLIYTNYYLKELVAPRGFLIIEGTIPVPEKTFELDSLGMYSCNIDCLNTKQHFDFKLHKYGEIFNSIMKNTSENGEFITYTTTNEVLANVEFSLYDENDELIESSVTDYMGIADIRDLEAGSYYYIEKTAPEQYQLNKEKITLVIEPDGRNLEKEFIASEKDFSLQPVIENDVYNELCLASVQIKKLGEQVKKTSSLGLEYEQIPLEGVVFGIYQNFEYKTGDGTVVPNDTCVGYLVTDEDGIAKFEAKIPSGQYYLKELKTIAGYEMDKENHYFDVKFNKNNNCMIQLDNDNIFMNMLSKASVKIIKTDANTSKPLKNVEFTLYDKNDNKIGAYKTNRAGEILIEDLPYGSYYFIETKCRNGYYSSNNKYQFKLVNHDTVILNITNQPILQLGFQENYKYFLIACSCLILFVFIFPWILRKGRDIDFEK